MIRLNLLGGVDLVGTDDESIQPVLQQPKRLALLVYLALDDPGMFRKRDTALLLFWPEVTDKRARNALSQTVHFLRRWLGPTIIVDHGPGELGTNGHVLWCDAVAFKQALKRGEWAEALCLYRGDLLAGFAIRAGPEFEQWLDGQRNQLRRDAAAAAWRLAEAAEASKQCDAAAEWARRAVELSLHDERAVQRLLGLLGRLGDGAGALEAYNSFMARLAQEYQAKPSIETRQIVASIRSGEGHQPRVERGEAEPVLSQPSSDEQLSSNNGRQGLRFAPLTPDVPSPLAGGSEHHASHHEVLTTGSGRDYRWLWAISTALCLLGIWALHATLQDHPIRSEETTHIVVENLAILGGSPRSADLGTALTSAIVDQLVRVRSFDVVSESPGEARYLSHHPNGSPNPRFRLTGDILQSGEHIRVDVTLTDVLSGRIARTAVFEHPAGAPLPLIDTLSRQIASLVRIAAGHEAQMHQWRSQLSDERAYDLMQEANDERDRAADLERSGKFQTAVRALERADSILGAVALIAPRWGEPLIQRAEVSKWLATLYMAPLRDPVLAESFLRNGIQEAGHAASLRPHDASALNTLGSLYYWYWLFVPLPADSASRMLMQAERSLRNAVIANPTRASTWNLLSASLYARADYSGAYLAAKRAYAADTYLQDSQEILNRLFLTSYEIGDDSASGYWCNEAKRQFAQSWTSAYCQLGLIAWTHPVHPESVAHAWRLAAEGAERSPQPQQARARLQMLVATVLARDGLRDSAEVVIRRARASSAGDAEILPLEADARIALRERDAAAALITQYVGEKPGHRIGVAHSRRFSTLQAF